MRACCDHLQSHVTIVWHQVPYAPIWSTASERRSRHNASVSHGLEDASLYISHHSRPGDQHRDCKASVNPYEDITPRISEYTAQQIAILQSKLDRQLGPEYISSRPGAGGSKVHYITAEKVINLANEVFGFNGWSSAIQDIHVDFIDPPNYEPENPNPRITLGLSATVRITLRDGTYHEVRCFNSTSLSSWLLPGRTDASRTLATATSRIARAKPRHLRNAKRRL